MREPEVCIAAVFRFSGELSPSPALEQTLGVKGAQRG